MHDPNIPPSDDSLPGDAPEPPGALLFDPSAPIPLDEMEAYGAAEEERPSRFPQIVFGMLAVAMIGLGAFYMSTGGEAGGDQPLPDAPTLPTAGIRPGEIVPIPRVDLEGRVGTRILVSVRVLGRGGVAMPDTTVRFEVESGDAVLTEAEIRTGTEGVGATELQLPVEPGVSVLTASVPGSNIVTARILASARAGLAANITVRSGNGQRAPIGELIPARTVVQVADEDGNPVPNAEVRFNVTIGNGIAAPSRTRTDSTGRASAIWRLGVVEGPQELTATLTDAQRQVQISATATPPVDNPRPGTPTNEPLESTSVTVRPQNFAVGSSHVCALDAGTLSCRGGSERGQSIANISGGYLAVTAGAAHTCALDGGGQAQCWGANDRGQIGDGSRLDKARLAPVLSDLRFSVLAAGESHTCGLAGGGVPLCWGQNLSGQLGDGTRNDQTVPRTVGGGMVFSAIAAGWNHTCGLTANGNAFCWGLNSNGQLGDGSTLDRLEPVLVSGAVSTVVAGSEHSCGISQGSVLCWGGNRFGQLGDDSNVNQGQPVQVVGLPTSPTRLAAGAFHNCALVQGGRAFCWGQNYSGQIGDGTTQNRARATEVTGGHQFVEIHAGGAQTCARTAAGTEYCWGLNQNGQLGDGTRANRPSPTRVGG